jgi:hypothetical protein
LHEPIENKLFLDRTRKDSNFKRPHIYATLFQIEKCWTPGDVLTGEAATLLAAKLKTPLQIGQHLVRAFEAGFEVGTKPIDTGIVEAILSRQINDLEPQLTRNGYDVRSLVEQFDAKPAEIRQLLRGELDPARTRELMDEMRAAGLPT